jgi:hypothetical protein
VLTLPGPIGFVADHGRHPVDPGGGASSIDVVDLLLLRIDNSDRRPIAAAIL